MPLDECSSPLSSSSEQQTLCHCCIAIREQRPLNVGSSASEEQDADQGDSSVEGGSPESPLRKPFGRASNHVRQCMALTKSVDHDDEDLWRHARGHNDERPVPGDTSVS